MKGLFGKGFDGLAQESLDKGGMGGAFGALGQMGDKMGKSGISMGSNPFVGDASKGADPNALSSMLSSPGSFSNLQLLQPPTGLPLATTPRFIDLLRPLQ